MIESSPSLCYLCGKPLTDPIDRDHVPPKQIFAKAIRQEHNPNLLTIPVHAACNKSFQHDEDYFAFSLMPMAVDSPAGEVLVYETLDKVDEGKNTKLHRMVLNEFEDRPSGLLLPSEMMIKRADRKRLERIAWKIIIGLFFHHTGKVLPQVYNSRILMYGPDDELPEHFYQVCVERESALWYGQHPDVFDYCFAKFPRVENLHYWALLLWEVITIVAFFHDLRCKCSSCRAPTQLALQLPRVKLRPTKNT